MNEIESGIRAANEETSYHLAPMAKCAHEMCSCTVASGERFCSDHCAQQANSSDTGGDEKCGCGHAECSQAAHQGVPVISVPLAS